MLYIVFATMASHITNIDSYQLLEVNVGIPRSEWWVWLTTNLHRITVPREGVKVIQVNTQLQ